MVAGLGYYRCCRCRTSSIPLVNFNSLPGRVHLTYFSVSLVLFGRSDRLRDHPHSRMTKSLQKKIYGILSWLSDGKAIGPIRGVSLALAGIARRWCSPCTPSCPWTSPPP